MTLAECELTSDGFITAALPEQSHTQVLDEAPWCYEKLRSLVNQVLGMKGSK